MSTKLADAWPEVTPRPQQLTKTSTPMRVEALAEAVTVFPWSKLRASGPPPRKQSGLFDKQRVCV